MATNSIEEQPIQATENEPMDLSPENKRPEEKSNVIIDMNALMSASKFKKGDTVHMSLRKGGTRSKGVFTIYMPRGHLHERGAWIRERELGEGS